MQNTNGDVRFGVLAREVFSWDGAIRWIALDDPGCQPLLEWRDPDAASAAGTMPGHAITVDPLLLMLAESREEIYKDSTHPHHLRFVVLAYRDRAQIVTRFGRYGHLNIGIGLAGDAYEVGTRLAQLLDRVDHPCLDTTASVPERQRQELRVYAANSPPSGKCSHRLKRLADLILAVRLQAKR